MLSGIEFAQARERRDVRILARLITVAENEPEEAYRILSDAGLEPGDSHVIGITGPPGVGKSSLVSALITTLRSGEETVAVLAIDPSSPFRGGALLGDRIRMNSHSGDPGVYIRSMATRGVLGGLSRAAWIAVRVLGSWGFDWIFIETAGVGQSEIDVVDLADTTVLVLSPGLGDDVQVMKAGIMEVADIFVVNKADLLGSERVRNSLISVLGIGESSGNHSEAEVYTTIANAPPSSSGVPELADGLRSRVAALANSEELARFRSRRVRVETRRAALALLGEMVDGVLNETEPRPAASETTGDTRWHSDPLATARQIVDRLMQPPGAGTSNDPKEL